MASAVFCSGRIAYRHTCSAFRRPSHSRPSLQNRLASPTSGVPSPLIPRAVRVSMDTRTIRDALEGCFEHMKATAVVVFASGLLAAPALADGVRFANLRSGSIVQAPVHAEFSVDGLVVKPAAEGLVEGTGHFHVLIDEKAPAEGEAIPFDERHRHYGKGQLADDLDLPPGKHTLTLVFANAQHVSYGPKYTQAISINVK